MEKSRNIIEINGKRYDAVTGQLLGNAITKKPASTGKAINDVVRSAHKPLIETGTKASTKQLQRKIKADVVRVQPAKPAPVRKVSPRQAHHLNAHTPEKTHTLARMGVHKPAPSNPKALVRVHAPVDSVFVLSKQKPTKFTHKVDSDRLSRAKSATPNNLVHHFNTSETGEKHRYTAVSLPSHKTNSSTQPVSLTSTTDGFSAKPHQNQFERAIQLARSHEQPPVPLKRHYPKKHHWLVVSIISLMILAIGGFLVIQNLYTIDIGLASMHADFTAKLPGYQPTGFSLIGHIQATYDQVILTYHTHTDSRNYSISQQVSNWDNQTLKSFIDSTGQPIQSWQKLGITFYKYGSHLTWVSGGVWYLITDHANLSNQQLLNIAINT